MNYTKSILSCMFLGLLMCLAGCAKQNKSKQCQLPTLKDSAHIDYQETKEKVTIRAKALTTFDCDTFLSDNGSAIMGGRNPLQPIQLCIENEGESAVLLFDANIGLPMVAANKVIARLTHQRFTASAIWGGISIIGLSLIVWIPIVLFTASSALVSFLAYVSICSFYMFVATPCIFIADNALFTCCPDEIKSCIHQTDKGKAVVIKPGKTIDMLIFVRKDEFKPTFDVTLLDENDQTKKQAFTVKLDNQIIAE